MPSSSRFVGADICEDRYIYINNVYLCVFQTGYVDCWCVWCGTIRASGFRCGL